METKSEMLVSSSKSVMYQLRDSTYKIYVRRRYASVKLYTQNSQLQWSFMDKNVSSSKYSVEGIPLRHTTRRNRSEN